MGFTPYDYVDRFNRGHLHLWDEAMRAKFQGQGKVWTRGDFDRVTGDFDVRNVPSSCYEGSLMPNGLIVHPRRAMLFLRRRPLQSLSKCKSHPEHARSG